MYESGYYPPGAEHDPRAPWNQKEPHYIKCEACNGKGYHYYAHDFEKDEDIECTYHTWISLPEKEEQARMLCQHFIRGDKEICEVCDGKGEVEYEEDFDPYDYE